MNRSQSVTVLAVVAGVFAGCQGTVGHKNKNPLPDGGGSDAGTTAFDGGPTVASYVGKVKNALVGLPPTAAEVQAVEADPGALEGLVLEWMDSYQTEYSNKMIDFFANAFQQSQVSPQDFGQQNEEEFGGAGNTSNLLLENLRTSFARTVWELIQEGQPFTQAMLTQRFMMTPALMSFYAAIDNLPTDDTGALVDRLMTANPTLAFTVNAGPPVPAAQSFDPTSPDYLVFGTASFPTGDPAPCSTISRVFNSLGGGFNASEYLYYFLWGYGLPTYQANVPLCSAFVAAPSFVQPSDFSDWRMVNIRPPVAPEVPNNFYDFVTFRALGTPGAATDLLLTVPRVGFFSTPAFFAGWQTNSSNQARVTMNQTLIVALGHAFDGTDTAIPTTMAALDSAHAAPGTACFACHETLDPARQYFRQSYSFYYHEQTDPAVISVPAAFAFDGVSQGGQGIGALAALLASHPRLATAWTQKLCSYATSATCDETDPEFVRIASDFTASNYAWSTLVAEVFSSPLVTQAPVTSITRREHLCALLSNRLGIDDVCGLQPTTPLVSPIDVISVIAAGYPADNYSRGAVAPTLANDPNLFMRSSLENICIYLAARVIDSGSGLYASSSPEAVIQDLTHNLMGLTGTQADAAQAILEQHYADAQSALTASGAGASGRMALRSTFVLACTSPYVAGLGL